MACGIYKITNNINGKVYIGQSTNIKSRFSAHKRAEKNIYLKRAYMKYGLDNFSFEIIEEVENKREWLDEREIYYIAKYRATSYRYGYNNKAGGFSGRHTEKTKRLIGEKSKNRPPVSFDTRMKLSIANKGHPFYGRRKMSKETIERMRKAQKERRQKNPVTEEFREKLRAIAKGRIIDSEQMERLRLANIGKKNSSETIERKRLAQKKRREREKSAQATTTDARRGDMAEPILCPVCGTLMYQGRCGNPSCGYVEPVDVETVGNAKAEGGGDE